MNGPVIRFSRSAASSSPLRSIGTAYSVRNCSAGPSSPGLVNSMIDHRSVSRFSTGVPVSAIRVAAGRLAHRLGLAGGGVLDVLGLVADHPAPLDRRSASGSRTAMP